MIQGLVGLLGLLRWHNGPVVTLRQKLVIGGLLVLAFGLLSLGVIYQEDDRLPTLPTPVGSEESGDGGQASPVEGTFPRTGIGSTCTEPVGVDLAAGWVARITINGNVIPESEMNAPLFPPAGSEISAGRSLGHFTYGPELGCPQGKYLLPQNNLVSVCYWRTEDVESNCVRVQFEFDAL